MESVDSTIQVDARRSRPSSDSSSNSNQNALPRSDNGVKVPVEDDDTSPPPAIGGGDESPSPAIGGGDESPSPAIAGDQVRDEDPVDVLDNVQDENLVLDNVQDEHYNAAVVQAAALRGVEVDALLAFQRRNAPQSSSTDSNDNDGDVLDDDDDGAATEERRNNSANNDRAAGKDSSNSQAEWFSADGPDCNCATNDAWPFASSKQQKAKKPPSFTPTLASTPATAIESPDSATTTTTDFSWPSDEKQKKAAVPSESPAVAVVAGSSNGDALADDDEAAATTAADVLEPGDSSPSSGSLSFGDGATKNTKTTEEVVSDSPSSPTMSSPANTSTLMRWCKSTKKKAAASLGTPTESADSAPTSTVDSRGPFAKSWSTTGSPDSATTTTTNFSCPSDEKRPKKKMTAHDNKTSAVVPVAASPSKVVSTLTSELGTSADDDETKEEASTVNPIPAQTKKASTVSPPSAESLNSTSTAQQQQQRQKAPPNKSTKDALSPNATVSPKSTKKASNAFASANAMTLSSPDAPVSPKSLPNAPVSGITVGMATAEVLASSPAYAAEDKSALVLHKSTASSGAMAKKATVLLSVENNHSNRRVPKEVAVPSDSAASSSSRKSLSELAVESFVTSPLKSPGGDDDHEEEENGNIGDLLARQITAATGKSFAARVRGEDDSRMSLDTTTTNSNSYAPSDNSFYKGIDHQNVADAHRHHQSSRHSDAQPSRFSLGSSRNGATSSSGDAHPGRHVSPRSSPLPSNIIRAGRPKPRDSSGDSSGDSPVNSKKDSVTRACSSRSPASSSSGSGNSTEMGIARLGPSSSPASSSSSSLTSSKEDNVVARVGPSSPPASSGSSSSLINSKEGSVVARVGPSSSPVSSGSNSEQGVAGATPPPVAGELGSSSSSRTSDGASSGNAARDNDGPRRRVALRGLLASLGLSDSSASNTSTPSSNDSSSHRGTPLSRDSRLGSATKDYNSHTSASSSSSSSGGGRDGAAASAGPRSRERLGNLSRRRMLQSLSRSQRNSDGSSHGRPGGSPGVASPRSSLSSSPGISSPRSSLSSSPGASSLRSSLSSSSGSGNRPAVGAASSPVWRRSLFRSTTPPPRFSWPYPKLLGSSDEGEDADDSSPGSRSSSFGGSPRNGTTPRPRDSSSDNNNNNDDDDDVSDLVGVRIDAAEDPLLYCRASDAIDVGTELQVLYTLSRGICFFDGKVVSVLKPATAHRPSVTARRPSPTGGHKRVKVRWYKPGPGEPETETVNLAEHTFRILRDSKWQMGRNEIYNLLGTRIDPGNGIARSKVIDKIIEGSGIQVMYDTLNKDEGDDNDKGKIYLETFYDGIVMKVVQDEGENENKKFSVYFLDTDETDENVDLSIDTIRIIPTEAVPYSHYITNDDAGDD